VFGRILTSFLKKKVTYTRLPVTNFILFLPCTFLQLIYQPTYALNKIQFITSVKVRHVCLILLCSKPPLGWHPGAETCSNLILVMNWILLIAFVG
jgi:hypothetical protein